MVADALDRRARGDAGPNSDWDLLVIVDDDAPPEKLTLRAGYEAARAYQQAANVVPVRASRFRARARIVGTLSYAAAKEGTVVFAR